MSIPEAKVICDSISPDGVRLTTMEFKIHRFVLAELNTHRVFSRNSASSRAVPTKKMLEVVELDPAMPVWWGKNEPGMSASLELEPDDAKIAQSIWRIARDNAVRSANQLLALNVHKQIVNRLLEPWMWHHVIVTATNWSNFFAQRCHKDAQPEMAAGAYAGQLAYYRSTPTPIGFGEWHLPYVPKDEQDSIFKWNNRMTATDSVKMISAARCARVSYLTHDGVVDVDKDFKLYARLSSAKPMHSSPFEHVATPYDKQESRPHKGNFQGWNQFRHEFPNESSLEFIPNHPELH